MATDIGGVWRTVGGRRIFIKDGQELASAMKESGKFETKKEEQKEPFKRIGKTAIQLDGMEEEYKKDIEEQLDILNQEYNNNLYGIEYSNEKVKHFGNIAMAETEGNEYQTSIKINGYGNKEEFNKMLKNEIAKGNIVNVDEENYGKYLVTHEYGHAITEFNMTESYKTKIENIKKDYIIHSATLEKEMKEKTNDFLMNGNTESWKKAEEISKELNKIKVSKYALTDTSEFTAECFANAKLSSNPSEYSLKVLELINQSNKKWK